MTKKQCVAEIKNSFFNEDINTTLKKVDDYFGSLNSFQKKRLIPLAALNYAANNEYEYEDYEKEIAEKLESILKNLLKEKKENEEENKENNIKGILSNIKEIQHCFALKAKIRYFRMVVLSKETYSYYGHQLKKYGNSGFLLLEKEIQDYEDHLIKLNLNSYKALSILTKIKREKETIHLGRMEKVDKPKIYELLSRNKLEKALNKLIGKENTLKMMDNEDWNYLDLLMKVRTLEKENHLGLMRLEDYLERRSLIFYELLGID